MGVSTIVDDSIVGSLHGIFGELPPNELELDPNLLLGGRYNKHVLQVTDGAEEWGRR